MMSLRIFLGGERICFDKVKRDDKKAPATWLGKSWRALVGVDGVDP